MTHIVSPAVGATIQLDTGISLVNNIGLYIYVQRPDLTTTIWTASAGSTPSSIVYTIQSGDLIQIGTYILSAGVSFAGTGVLYGDPLTLNVKSLYEV